MIPAIAALIPKNWKVYAIAAGALVVILAAGYIWILQNRVDAAKAEREVARYERDQAQEVLKQTIAARERDEALLLARERDLERSRQQLSAARRQLSELRRVNDEVRKFLDQPIPAAVSTWLRAPAGALPGDPASTAAGGLPPAAPRGGDGRRSGRVGEGATERPGGLQPGQGPSAAMGGG